ncbi:hypothetical protein E1H18_3006 [Caulobacter sp. RHG1]|nr:hypothetical protein [Caulobacter sp. RHG1]
MAVSPVPAGGMAGAFRRSGERLSRLRLTANRQNQLLRESTDGPLLRL